MQKSVTAGRNKGSPRLPSGLGSPRPRARSRLSLSLGAGSGPVPLPAACPAARAPPAPLPRDPGWRCAWPRSSLTAIPGQLPGPEPAPPAACPRSASLVRSQQTSPPAPTREPALEGGTKARATVPGHHSLPSWVSSALQASPPESGPMFP